MKNVSFAITILFLVLLSLSLLSILIPAFAPIAIAPVPLCVYYLAALAVAGSLNARFPI